MPSGDCASKGRVELNHVVAEILSALEKMTCWFPGTSIDVAE